MNIKSWCSNWWGRQKNDEPSSVSGSERREFIYLDDISVLSILASHQGGISTEFTENQTTSLSSEVKGSLSAGVLGTKANLGTNLRTSEAEVFQVARKAIIQSSFKELYDIEHAALPLRPASTDELPSVNSEQDLEGLLGSSRVNGLLIDPTTLHRGDLLEFDIELEADPIYRVATIITTFLDIMSDNQDLFGNAVATQVPEVRSIARLLENLLTGLVPIRGRLVDYVWVEICGREVLAHESLLCYIAEELRPNANSAYLVGVTQRDLFWKDIRRVLFSQARYTVFCRLAASGLSKGWNPIKMADVFSGLSSDFEGVLQGLGDEMMSAFSEGMRSTDSGANLSSDSDECNDNLQRDEHLLRRYAESLAAYHSETIDPFAVEALITGIPRTENWLDSVDGYRPVFDEVTRRVERSLGVETPRPAISTLRTEVLPCSGHESASGPEGSSSIEESDEPGQERFLDSEIIAIYW